MTDYELRENERIDDLGRRGYHIIQNKKQFCFGIDAVLLAWFSEVHSGDKVIDLGTGTGIIPLLMDARNGYGDYTGLELQEDMAAMAQRSVLLNQVEDHVRMVQGDLKEAAALFGKGNFDVVTSNPPYMKAGTGIVNPESGKAIARHEIFCTLDDVVREAAALLKNNGRFYMVHRPSRLTGILEAMKTYKIGPSRLVFVHPYEDKEATMVLVAGTKGGRDILQIDPPIVVYKEENVYTDRIGEIYGDGRH